MSVRQVQVGSFLRPRLTMWSTLKTSRKILRLDLHLADTYPLAPTFYTRAGKTKKIVTSPCDGIHLVTKLLKRWGNRTPELGLRTRLREWRRQTQSLWDDVLIVDNFCSQFDVGCYILLCVSLPPCKVARFDEYSQPT